MSQAVVFLARGCDGGRSAAEEFFAAYCRHRAGRAHDLIVIAKGWQAVPGLDELRRSARGLGGTVAELPDDGFDFGAYFRIAAALNQRWICLLNTHARPAAEDWLDKLRAAAEVSGIGAAGATGSWGSLTPQLWSPGRSLAGIAAWPVRFGMSIGRFAKFPNPHLRSNGLCLRRELLVAFAEQSGRPMRKADAHYLESGRGGLTAFLRRRGLRPVVVGADGRGFEADEWIASGTFRVPGQANLMIKDNQSQLYAKANSRQRRVLEFAAWGRTFSP